MTRTALLVGAGLAVTPHLHALRETGVDLRGVVTTSAARAARVREVFPDAAVFDDLDAALGAGAELAILCTPAHTHAELARRLATAGLDLVVEKPLGVDLASARACVDAAREAGTRLAVVFQHRYKPAAGVAREVLDGGRIGDIVAASVAVPWWRPQSYYDEPGRGALGRDGGGALITQAIHTLDLYRWLTGPVTGPVTRVTATRSTSVAHSMESEDVVHGILEHTGSHRASLFASTAVRFGSPESIELFGTDGTLRIVGSSVLLRRETEECLLADERPAGGADPAVMAPWFTAMYADVVESWSQGRDPDCDGGSALETQALVSALYESAARGTWVDLATDTSEMGDADGAA